MRNYDEIPCYCWIPPMAGLLLGALTPFTALSHHTHVDHLFDTGYKFLLVSTMVLVALLFERIGKRHQRLRHWASDTLTGVTLMLFAYGLLVTALPLVLVLLPLPAPVLFMISVLFFVAAGYTFFETAEPHED